MIKLICHYLDCFAIRLAMTVQKNCHCERSEAIQIYNNEAFAPACRTLWTLVLASPLCNTRGSLLRPLGKTPCYKNLIAWLCLTLLHNF